MAVIQCKGCGKEEEHHAHQLCSKCYRKKWKPELAICVLCKKEKPHHAKGYCSVCYNKTFHKEYYRMASRKQGGVSMEIFEKLPKCCMICGFDKIIDVHHLIAKSKGGTHNIENLTVLCPNHHKMIHHADYSEEIKAQIAGKLSKPK